MIAITGISDVNLFALISGAIAMLVGRRSDEKPHCSDCELRDLMLRERHPWIWARRNPRKAIERLFR